MYQVTPENEHEHKGRLLLGDPRAEAWEWMQGYLANLNSMIDEEEYEHVSLTELFNHADSHCTDSNGWGDYITRGGAFEGFGTDPTFWDKYQILKGEPIPQKHRNNFFSCSC